MFAWAWLFSTWATAQEWVEPPSLMPGASVATEDGPAALWVNPAALAYDADPRWGVFLRNSESPSPWAGGLTAGIAGVGAGLRWTRQQDGSTDFDLDFAAGVRLPRRVAVGAALRWALIGNNENYVAFDASLAWRPLPWLGVTALARNIGDPGPSSRSVPVTGGGLALRPAGRVLVLGLDVLHHFGGPDPGVRAQIAARVRPIEGLYLRTSLDSRLRFSAGLELYFGGVGGGVVLDAEDWQGRPTAAVWIGSDEPGENLVPPRRQVEVVQLDRTPPYEPARRLVARQEASWLEILHQLEHVAASPDARGTLLQLGDVDLPWARWQELRRHLARQRTAGKIVVVHLSGDVPAGAVYAASVADRVLVHPASTVQLTGLYDETLYLRGLLDAVGVGVEVIRRGDHKSAGEPYQRRGPSEEDKAQRTTLLIETLDEMLRGLSEGRGRTLEEVAAWTDRGPWTAREAARMGIVDGIAYPDQLRAHLAELHGGRVRESESGRRPRARSPWEAPVQIGVVYVDGLIVPGESSTGGPGGGRTSGAVTIGRQLQRVIDDPAIRALVLRIDSPGGSVWASDEIARGIARVRAAGKPVIASLGGTAASGGYYIAAAADTIWAEPSTVTGSIGVIAIRPNVAGLLDRLGVQVGGVSAGRGGDLDSVYRPLDPVQELRVQALVDDAYERFLDHVAAGRHLDVGAVRAVAEGRLWTGRAALGHDLIDALGSLPDAVADARRLAGIGARRPVDVVAVRADRPLVELLLPELSRLRVVGRPPNLGAALTSGPLAPFGDLMTILRESDELLWMLADEPTGAR